MLKHELFEREILLLENEDLRNFARWYLDNWVGDWFWKSGASASGKHHPDFAKGEGGLVRHTRAVCMVCEELLRMSTYAYMKAEYKDYARLACLLHDTCKYGGTTENHDCYKEHGKLAAANTEMAWSFFFGEGHIAPDLLLMAIKSHMGQWVENREDRPFTNIDRLVHLSDYIASRDFWDIPIINFEYMEDTKDTPCTPLPF